MFVLDKSLIFKNLKSYGPFFLFAFFSLITLAAALQNIAPMIAGFSLMLGYAAMIMIPFVALTAKTQPKRSMPQVVLFLMTVWGLILIATV
jgi:hypothetical protein